MSKRVYCLYRVSTKDQVEKNDIPMQKQRCHEFAEQQGWTILKEFSEKGISGFKVSAKDRDAIQEIQQDAAQGKFDVLLVFMFDRLGRKEDETPFVVEWFVQNGIEVWSTEEGQQKFDHHVDKLMNYIRYWQASGESIKTSIRTKTRLGQIVTEGRFRGGVPPYGYKLEKRGRLGKKNRELYEIEINPEEAVAVQKIFDLAEKHGYGGRKISTELRKEGILNLRTGLPFHYSSIQNILKNIMYMGILRSGESRSDIFPELQIIPPDTFEQVQKGREQRSAEYAKKCGCEDGFVPRSYPRKIVGKALLSGNIYCGHCGGRMFASTARKSHHKNSDAPTERVAIYKCYLRSQYDGSCDGPCSYRAAKIDAVILELLNGIFERSKAVKERDLIARQAQTMTASQKQRLRHAKKELEKRSQEVRKWEDLMLASVEGTCPFTPEQIRRRMDTLQQEMDRLSEQCGLLQSELDAESQREQALKTQYQRLLSWASIFEGATIDEKKVIASQIIKSVTISRDYRLRIEFNITEAEYLSGLALNDETCIL